MIDDGDSLLNDFDHRHPWHRALSREFSREMRKPAAKSMRRMERMWPEFADATMDFILDVVDTPSIWAGYETWNRRHFGVALPITEGEPGEGLSPARLRHFVWKLLNISARDFNLPPDHPDVRMLVDVAGSFWEKRKDKLPPLPDSSAFFAGPVRYGWQAKNRLVILGQTSYFFRSSFDEHIMPHKGSATVVNALDDFFCQSCSQWSGMGPVDLLAEILDLPEARRDDIRDWSQRHAAPYRMDSLEKGYMLVTNLVTDEQYRVDRDEGGYPIPVGVFVFGFLARWDGGWRWSGMQNILAEDESGLEHVKDFVQKMRKTSAQILCRYWPEYREQVFEFANRLHKSELEFHDGRDLVYFGTGEEIAVDTNRFLNEYCYKRAQDLGLTSPDVPKFDPETVLPEEIRETDNGVALFLNPNEGGEMMRSYDDLTSALRKKGKMLTDAERAVLRDFIQSQVISPAFVHRVLQDEPEESLRAEFGLNDDAPAYQSGKKGSFSFVKPLVAFFPQRMKKSV